MVEPNAASSDEMKTAENQKVGGRLGGIGWALFFIWIGIALLLEFPAAVTLLGIGAITLGVQMARKSAGLHLEGFWLVIGLLFVVAGVWDLIGTADVRLLPILLILAGVVGLFSIFRR